MGYTSRISDPTPGAHGDILSDLTIAAGHSNFGKLFTVTAPPEWYIATDKELPNGAAVGTIQALSTLSIANGACTTSVPVTIPMFKATNNIENTVEWIGDGSNLTTDNDNNGLPEAIDKYPSFLNETYHNLKPRIRYYGFTNAVQGAPPTQLNFTVFSPGQFAGAAGYPGFPNPEHEVGDSYGYINYVQLDNPYTAGAPSTITEFCTPLRTVTDLSGRTRGEGELKTQCGNSLDDDLDGDVNDGCAARCGTGETAPCPGESVAQCANAVDDDGDGWVNDGCIANGASEGTGSPELTAFCNNQCINGIDDDIADNDGVVNDGCPPVGAAETNCTNVNDDDGDGWVNDGCIQVGASFESDLTGIDNDGDGLADDGCIVVTDYCSNQLDDDQDGAVDEDCLLVRATNPKLTSGVGEEGLKGNSHIFRAYGQSFRDADGDGISNNEDGCPYTADRATAAGNTSRELALGPDGVDDGGGGDDECGTAAAGYPGDGFDDDGDNIADDGCPGSGVPTKEKDLDGAGTPGAGLGDICQGACAGGIANDCDNDGYQNRQDNCPQTPNGIALDNQADTDASRCNEAPGSAVNDDAADDGVVNDGCPTRWSAGQEGMIGNAESGGQCVNALDDDNDGYVNDGCPMVGVIAESCVTTDMGPCSDSIGDACDTDNTALDGAMAKDLVVAAICIGDGVTAGQIDNDGDGWCDDIDPDDTDPNKTPEEYRLDYKVMVGGVAQLMDPVPGLCSDYSWYVSAGDAMGNGVAVDNDGDGNANAADADCATIANDDDQDGVTNASDNCPSVYNPEQLDYDRDTLFSTPAGYGGDACDADDDNDFVKDADEWRRASNQKNQYDPINFDVTADGVITGGDSSRYGPLASGILNVGGTGRPPLVLQAKSVAWFYLFLNVGAGVAVDDIDIEFSALVIVTMAFDSDGGTWTCSSKVYAGEVDRKWHCDRDSGTLSDGGVLTIVAQSQGKKNVVDFVWSTP